MTKILIVHYNTPKLTDCLVKSINKYMTDTLIYIFDNSDKQPFVGKYDNVKILDNTKGQIINFDKWLSNYPNRKNSPGSKNAWGSAKHCYTVEKAMDIINDNFILLDSDVLLMRDISNICLEDSIYTAEVVTQPKSNIKRVLPFICFINVKMCKKYNVHYFDENYMHGLACNKVNKRADMYDTGGGFFINASKYKHTDIKYGNYVIHFKGGSWENVHKQMYNTQLTADEWINLNKRYWSSDMNKKVIYTCITGAYEMLDDPKYVNKDFDYICFTNYDKITSRVWQIRPIPSELNGLTEVKKQRCIKIMPHKYLPEYDLSIWVDGCVKLKSDVNELIRNCNTDASILIPKHPARNCIYDEMEACRRAKKDKIEIMKPQIDRYKAEGFPAKYGLVQSNIIIRKHNNDDCKKLMETWWEELKKGSHRDQLSFNYATWKHQDVKIFLLDKNVCNSKYFYWEKTHGKVTKTPYNKNVMPVKKNVIMTDVPKPEKPANNNVVVRKKITQKYSANILDSDEVIVDKNKELIDKIKALTKKIKGETKRTGNFKDNLETFIIMQH